MSVYHKAGNAEADEKMGLSALLAQSSTPGIATTGVLWGLAVTQTTTASGSVQIAQGAGAVQGSATAGASLLYNPAPTLNILTAHPVGSLPRNDIVVFDSTTGSVSSITGVANATPTDPTIPNTALPLARIRNVANAAAIDAAHIDDLRTYTRLTGTDTPAYSRRVQNTGKSIPDSTWTTVDGWNLVEQSNMTYSSGVWTVLVAGRYKITGQISFGLNANPAGQRGARLTFNGAVIHEHAGKRADPSYNVHLTVLGSVNAQVGDTFSVLAYNSQGVAQTTLASDGACHMSFDRISGT